MTADWLFAFIAAPALVVAVSGALVWLTGRADDQARAKFKAESQMRATG